MYKKHSTLILSVFILNLFLGTAAFAGTTEDKATKLAESVKAAVSKLGTGKDAQVQIKLKNGTKLKGYVNQTNENSFVVTEGKTGVLTEVPYPNAKQVKGNNLSTGAKIAIGIGIGVGVLIIIYAALVNQDGF